MITSFIDGRVRVRHAALRNTENMQVIVDMLGQYPGVQSATPNLRTGSILVLYDTEQISREMLQLAEQALREHLAENMPENVPDKTSNREQDINLRGLLKSCFCSGLSRKSENRMLGLTLGLCLAGCLGAPRLHAWAGGTFVFMALGHALRRARV